MRALILIGVLVAAAAVIGWRGWRLAAVALAGWAVTLAALLVWPQGAAARLVGFGPQGWVLLGGLTALALGYRAALAALRRRAHPLPAPTPSPQPAAPDPAGPLSDDELDRYARHIVLRELGGPGQRRLKAARVLVVGAGGLGAPVCLYLAAAGVGQITLADDDVVSLSNLQRQVIFATGDVNRPKAAAAADAMARLNPHVAVTSLLRRIGADDAALVGQHDLVIEGTDSFASRAAVNAACVAAGVPLIAGAIAQWEGQVTIYDPARGAPCLACLFPEPPAPGLAPGCAEAGVVGALPGIIGSLMALEAIKLIARIPDSGAGQGLRGRMILFDGLWGETRSIAVSRRPGCAVCDGVA